MSFDALVVENGGWNDFDPCFGNHVGLVVLVGFSSHPFDRGSQGQSLQDRNHLEPFFEDVARFDERPKIERPCLGDAWFWSVGGFFYLVIVKLSGRWLRVAWDWAPLWLLVLLLGLGIMGGSLFVAYLNRGKIELGLTVIGGLIMPVSLVILFLSKPVEKSLTPVACL